jgi:hypothetical protein
VQRHGLGVLARLNVQRRGVEARLEVCGVQARGAREGLARVIAEARASW